jgi:phage baseplate assembly protein W
MPILNSRRRISPLDLNKNVKIGVAFPLDEVNLFTGTQTVKEQVKSNLINLLLTVKGERVNQPRFGVGIRNLLFENKINLDGLKENIKNQINIYIPEISLINVIVRESEDGHKIFIIVSYRFISDGITDAVQLNFK